MTTPEYEARVDKAVQNQYLFIEFRLGTDIKEAANLAWLFALRNELMLPVKFTFNGIPFIVHRDTEPKDIVLMYEAKTTNKRGINHE